MAKGDMRDGLVAYWKLDEASGDRADSHGSYTLTDNNTVTQAAGVIGNAASFAAANNEYLSRSSSADLGFSSSSFFGGQTFTGWFYLSSLPAEGQSMTLLSKWEFTDASILSPEYRLDVWTDSGITALRWSVCDANFIDNTQSIHAGSLATGQWYFVAAGCRPGENGALFLYLDGENVAEGAFNNCVANNARFRLGADENGHYLNGRLDEVGVFGQLNDSEIRDLYNSGSGLAYPLENGPDTVTRMRGLR